MTKITNLLTGQIIFEAKVETMREALELAVAQDVNLEGADLQYEDLRGAKLQGADLRLTHLEGGLIKYYLAPTLLDTPLNDHHSVITDKPQGIINPEGKLIGCIITREVG